MIDATDVGEVLVNVTFSVLTLSSLSVSMKLLPNKSSPSYISKQKYKLNEKFPKIREEDCLIQF